MATNTTLVLVRNPEQGTTERYYRNWQDTWEDDPQECYFDVFAGKKPNLWVLPCLVKDYDSWGYPEFHYIDESKEALIPNECFFHPTHNKTPLEWKF